MANNYLKRRFTLRETILLIVLLVVLLLGLYFGLVYYPISTRTAEVNDELGNVQMQIDVATALKADYDRMKAELERILSGGDDTVMPQYGNNEQQEILAACFTTVFAGLDSAGISYGTPSAPNDGVRTRTITFTFTVKDKGTEESVYARTKTLLHNLMNTGFRCSMSSLSLTPTPGDLQEADSIGVNCVINFYELDSGSN